MHFFSMARPTKKCLNFHPFLRLVLLSRTLPICPHATDTPEDGQRSRHYLKKDAAKAANHRIQRKNKIVVVIEIRKMWKPSIFRGFASILFHSACVKSFRKSANFPLSVETVEIRGVDLQNKWKISWKLHLLRIPHSTPCGNRIFPFSTRPCGNQIR